MKTLVFDTGPIISLAMNNLLWVLKHLERDFGGEFIITPFVKKEGIDRPIKSKRYKFQAMQVMKLFNDGTLKLIESKKISSHSRELLELANSIFSSRGENINIVHEGEIQTIAAALLLGSKALVVDERTTRMLIEAPYNLQKILAKKTQMHIEINEEKMKQWQHIIVDIHIIRSTELVALAFEKGYLNDFIPDIRSGKEELLDGLLWGLRLNGCAISYKEIAKLHKIERKLLNI